jgi:hypothetical protein
MMLGFECGEWWQSLLRVTSADLLKNVSAHRDIRSCLLILFDDAFI